MKKESEKVSSVTSYTYNELKPLLEKDDGKTYVINFWATWCAPCVKELPAFEKLNQEYAAKNVEVILVSLDFPKQVDKRLIPFINKNNLQSKVVLLNDVNEDVWIKAIDSTWSGALPATLIYNAKGRKFYEQSFDYEKLETELQSIL
ncbi:TlpA family protein disulfide reductase [Polaribacter sp. Z014]|uniref:TlpA disulfide reductase family protein n=1 Tax=unclassified Polaribacter TaxID=196858 RepID=UPI0020212688|nr:MULTISPECIES: TlpA disulfide reductase family protein [unclassified Polaribacter]MCL7763018.1 TlpA family protein disulfide reductase [Polaribacter sp. Z014]